jgi:hypothetical protein
MGLACIRVLAFAIAIVTASYTQAAVVLPNLPAGSQYQLVLVTAGGRNATSTNIADYNSFVSQQVALGLSFGLPNTTWRAIASTSAVNARTNAQVFPNIPIYNTHGQLVANGMSDFWFPSHLAAINYDQFGIAETFPRVWTGSQFDGTAGNALGAGSTAGQGRCTIYQDAGWITNVTDGLADVVPLYALSAPITVPEPSSVCGVVAVVCLAFARRR